MKKLAFILVPALILLSSAVAFAQGNLPVTVREDPKLGKFLADSKGMTLYMYKNDKPNESNCYDACATAWPPLLATGAVSAPAGVTGKLDTTTRRDGAKQVTIEGLPLYYFAQDAKPGDVNGQDFRQVWYVVDPAGKVVTGSAVAATGAGGAAGTSGGAAGAGQSLPRSGGPILPVGAAAAAGLAALGLGLWQRRR